MWRCPQGKRCPAREWTQARCASGNAAASLLSLSLSPPSSQNLETLGRTRSDSVTTGIYTSKPAERHALREEVSCSHHVPKTAAGGVPERNAPSFLSEDPLNIRAGIQCVIKARWDCHGALGVSILYDDEVIALKEWAPLLQEVQVSDGWNHDVQDIFQTARHDGMAHADSARQQGTILGKQLRQRLINRLFSQWKQLDPACLLQTLFARVSTSTRHLAPSSPDCRCERGHSNCDAAFRDMSLIIALALPLLAL